MPAAPARKKRWKHWRFCISETLLDLGNWILLAQFAVPAA